MRKGTSISQFTLTYANPLLTFRVKFAEDGLEVGLAWALYEGCIPVGNGLSILRMMNNKGKMKDSKGKVTCSIVRSSC